MIKDYKETEDFIQKSIEQYLTLENIRFFRIPDGVYGYLSKAPSPIKKMVSLYFRGLPDLVIFEKNQKGFNHCLLLELKRAKGKITQGQKNWHKGLNVKVAYSIEEAKEEINKFLEFIDDEN